MPTYGTDDEAAAAAEVSSVGRRSALGSAPTVDRRPMQSLMNFSERSRVEAAAVACWAAEGFRRLQATAAVFGGRSLATAKVGDRNRQTLRDRAHRCDADGPKGLFDRRAPGKPSELTKAQQTQAQRTATSGAHPGRAHLNDPSRPRARALLARPRPRCAAAWPALHHGPGHGRPGCGGAWCQCSARRARDLAQRLS